MTIVERVSIQISDPWEIVSEVGDGALSGRLQNLASTAATVLLDEPVRVSGKSTHSVSAVPRHTTGDLMKSDGPVAAQLMFLNDDGTPAFAAIGTLTRHF
jgi:hypothetical protein